MSALSRILVLGSGAREHALGLALAKGSPEREVVVAPGNAGSDEAPLRREMVNLADFSDVLDLARRLRAELIVVGPEAPLCGGIVDALSAAGFLVFGPTRAAAKLEASKAFLKELAQEAGIKSAAFEVVHSMAAAEQAITARGAPIVVKADGLCAGKGVVVAQSVEEALTAARNMLVERVFGDAGATVVLEECLLGREVSVHAITDGERYFLLPAARDHKRLRDGDRGPNTGGMGVVCPAPDVGEELLARIGREVIEPTLRVMRERGTPFSGVLFAGLMVNAEGEPFLLEHNVRFGDPECEALMPMIEGDLAELLASAARGKLTPESVQIARDRHALVLILAAGGYPEQPRKGDVIAGFDEAGAVPGVTVLHAGTEFRGKQVVTAGGRVLAITASHASPAAAREAAYRAADLIVFAGKQFRTDIGDS